MGQKYGQHFLKDPLLLDRICQAVCRTAPATIIEIGPGQGALTEGLLASGATVHALEIDPLMVEALGRKFPGHARLHVHAGDCLQADLTAFGPAVLAGNLPYYITSPILEQILRAGPLLAESILLIQREVAERVVARHGSRDFGYLSVMVQSAATAELLFPVPPGAFRPPPRVDSAVIRLTPLPPDPEWSQFLAFASLCFQQKRKMLRNNLQQYFPRDVVQAMPEATLRAEQLSIADLKALWQRLRPHRL